MMVVLGGGGVTTMLVTRRPSNDRAWAKDQQVLPHVTVVDSTIRIEGFRRFRYPSADSVAARWDTTTVDLRALRSIWFVLALFSDGWRAPAHTFVSFGFDDSSYVAVSVEARRETEEPYGILRGVARNYELIYVIGDEQDLIGRRVAANEGDVYLYPVVASPEQAQALFLDMVERAERLRRAPEFYNTVSNSCNSNLVDHVNRIAPGAIPGGLKLLLPGYADEVAHGLGLIDAGASLDDARRRYRINERGRPFLTDPTFSVRIRG